LVLVRSTFMMASLIIIFVEDAAPTAGNVEIQVQNNNLNLNWIPDGGSSNTKVAFSMVDGGVYIGSNSTHLVSIDR